MIFNSDWSGYSPDSGSHPNHDTEAWLGGHDGLGYHGNIGVGPYSSLVLVQKE